MLLFSPLKGAHFLMFLLSANLSLMIASPRSRTASIPERPSPACRKHLYSFATPEGWGSL